MGFSKAFPVRSDKSVYPRWEDVELTEAEEKEVEALARSENIKIMKECIRDAKDILKDESLKDFQTNMVQIAIALFEKRASHAAYWKEEKARQKFLEGRK
ncbi:hypothetical protein D6764_03965 [Candidatus Woesearchaeota archaeon]|nr:MAG: hypothetical protein D6764_03965 [Candidatus Woesearchaeota archaeon]